MWSKIGIRKKVFILFLLLSLAPLLSVSIIWLRSNHNQLKAEAISRQTITLGGAGKQLDDALSAKVASVVARSQDTSVINLSLDQAVINLLQYANQDTDIKRISLVDTTGAERISIVDRLISSKLGSFKDTEAFAVVAQASNEAWIGAVDNSTGDPSITISVPLYSISKLGDQSLTPGEAIARRFGSDAKGALIVTILMKNLFLPITRTSLGKDGDLFLVDKDGKLIASPDGKLISRGTDLSKIPHVAEFLAEPKTERPPKFTTSMGQVPVLASHYFVETTGWGLMAHEPTVSIYASANQVLLLVVTIVGIVIGLAFLLSLYFSGTLTKPIEILVAGAAEIGSGKLDTRIPIKSSDEIGVLAENFNTMGEKLKRLISNLESESSKLNFVLDSVNEGILATDAQSRIVHANVAAAVLIGTLPTEVFDKKFDDLYRMEQSELPFLLDRNSTTVYSDITLRSVSGHTRYVDIFVNRIEGDPDGITNIITIRDKTEERELERMKFDFVSLAAHELRTPITAIRGYLHLLSMDQDSSLSAKSSKSVERAQASTRQLVGLINNLLNVSKIERGSLDISFAKFDWAKSVQEVLADQRFTAEEKNVILSYEGPAEGIFLYADDIAIKEVLNNLVSNAIRYTPTGGIITVKLSTENDLVLTAVKDPGVGIPADAVSHLFTKFYRVKGLIESGSAGTGLGLYICKSIIDLHKGKIWAESQVDKGSTFSFSLPAYTVQYDQDTQDQGSEVRKRRGWITKNITR